MSIFKSVLIIVVVAFIHYIVLYFTRFNTVGINDSIEKDFKEKINIKIEELESRSYPEERVEEVLSHSKTISFKDLKLEDTSELIAQPNPSGETGGKSCLGPLIREVGSFPKSFYLKKITGHTQLSLIFYKKEVYLKLQKDENWLIGNHLCYQMKNNLEKLKGNSCLRSLARERPYLFTFNLSLEIGQDEETEIFHYTDDSFHKKITKMSPIAPKQLLKVISNVATVLEFTQTDADRLEWSRLDSLLRRFDCKSLRLNI